MKGAIARGRLALVERFGAKAAGGAAPDAAATLGALPVPVVTLDAENRVRYANQAAEQALGLSLTQLVQLRMDDVVAADSPLLQLIEQARVHDLTIADHDLMLEGPRLRARAFAAQVAPVPEEAGSVAVVLQDSSAARALDRQQAFRNAARSVTGMAAILAHEVKNPLSGIRGAAQLLEGSVGPEDRELTVLICEEADRIKALVERMEVFGDRPVGRRAVNIHRVLEHVRRLAQTGFAAHLRVTEAYDPSLPPVWGNRDQLVQVLLNLVKNAAEALTDAGADGPTREGGSGGEIALCTAYQHGLRVAVPGTDQRRDLPLVVTVRDNGPGIPEDILPHLFEPFVTSKPAGSGLGLALVAKIVGDHGGLVEVESRPGRTEFRICLPVAPDADGE
jgi:two-component system, NtrC family, nitrogen regulation sensor histidine kinase GlnL